MLNIYIMNNIKTFATAAAMTLCSGAVMAQATFTDKNDNEYEFVKHTYLQLQGGAQHTIGEAKFDKLLSPNAQIAVGYQFLPWMGARIAVNAWQSKGGWNDLTSTVYKYKYVAPTLDLSFNLLNAFGGYNPLRKVDLNLFVGGGANIGFSNDEANELAANGKYFQYLWDGTEVRGVGRAGLAIDVHVCKAVSIGLECNANMLSDHYNSKHGGNCDWYINGLLGVKVNLGKTYNKKEKKVVTPMTEVTPAQTVVKEEPAVVKQEEPKPTAPQVFNPVRKDVFFAINSAVIRETELAKVRELATVLKENPKTKVNIVGYADAETGNDEINNSLGERRANAVRDMLIKEYGIAADRISVDSKGAKEQPFSVNEQNRVSICIVK